MCELSPLHAVLKWLPMKSIKHDLQSTKWIERYGTLSIQHNRAIREKGQEASGTLSSKIVTQGDETMLTDYEVVAGSETTAITIMRWGGCHP
jgi:hypothetical protein